MSSWYQKAIATKYATDKGSVWSNTVSQQRKKIKPGIVMHSFIHSSWSEWETDSVSETNNKTKQNKTKRNQTNKPKSSNSYLRIKVKDNT